LCDPDLCPLLGVRDRRVILVDVRAGIALGRAPKTEEEKEAVVDLEEGGF
jgi:hypothetical protein